MRRLTVPFFLLLSAGLSACSGSGGAREAVPLEECPDLAYSTCDPLNAGCQSQLLGLASCIYGVTAMPHVPVRVLTEDELTQELAEGSTGLEDIDAPDRAPLESALVELGLAAPGDFSVDGAARELARRVDGLYLDARRGIVLVDRGPVEDAAEYNGLLVREFAHAVQDAQYDVTAWRERFPRDLDASLALRSVIEGQATLVQYRAWAAMSGRDANYIEWNATFINLRRSLTERARDDGSSYWGSQTNFPYGFGAVLANRAWLSEGRAYHADQFQTPPETTLDVIAQNMKRDIEAGPTPPFSEPLAPEGYRVVRPFTIGSFLLGSFAAKLGDDSTDPLAVPLTWRGDRLAAFVGPEEESSWVWQIQLEDTPSAEKLKSLAAASGLTAETEQNRIFIAPKGEPPSFVLDAGRAFLVAE